MNVSEMEIGGALLKRARLNCRLTFRDVERLSRAIGEQYGDDRYIVRISMLSRIENHAAIPNIFHLHSLCAIYSVEMRKVLRWYGLPDQRSRKSAAT
jgi:hypothetical protein